MRRTGNNKPQELRARWLLTFNDMMTLLFAFFVLIISMSHLDAAKVKGVAASARKVIGLVSPRHDYGGELVQASSRYLPGGLEDRKKALAQSLLTLGEVMVLPRKDGLTVTMGEPLLFAPGSAGLVAKGQQLLSSLGEILQRTDVDISVEVHTDELPPTGGSYPSNWELSLARAVNAVKYLATQGGVAPGRLSAAGYGASKPKAANSDGLARQTNRRVEIILRFSEN